jgi:hypothetical protein
MNVSRPDVDFTWLTVLPGLQRVHSAQAEGEDHDATLAIFGGIDVHDFGGGTDRTGNAPEDRWPGSRIGDADARLSAYLNDHHAGSAAAIQLANRCRERHRDSDLGRHLRDLVDEIEDDQHVLAEVMTAVGAQANPVKRAGALGAEILTRLKQWVPILGSGSGVASVEEMELLTLGVEGKQLLWRLLGELSGSDERLQGFDFTALAERAQVQQDGLEPFRARLGMATFGR